MPSYRIEKKNDCKLQKQKKEKDENDRDQGHPFYGRPPRPKQEDKKKKTKKSKKGENKEDEAEEDQEDSGLLARRPTPLPVTTAPAAVAAAEEPITKKKIVRKLPAASH